MKVMDGVPTGMGKPLASVILPAVRSRRLVRLKWPMTLLCITAITGLMVPGGGAGAAAAQDQDQPPPSGGAYARLSGDQLERLVAPIALYPDALVAQILTASTFPTQLVDAQQWLTAHPGLSPADLAAQADTQSWDPSVKALLQYPSVLSDLSSNLGWTSELGDAYYNQADDVMKAIQEMRKKAKKAGTLMPTPQLNVQDQDNQITIAPADPDVVYVPAYDPWTVYGYALAPWPGWVDVPGIWWNGPGIYFGVGFPIAPFLGYGWGWGGWGLDWAHHHVFFNNAPYFARGPAFFDRGGYYGGRSSFARPGNIPRVSPDRNAYRGYSAPRSAPGVRSGAFSGFDHGGTVRGFSARGQSSFGGFRGGGGFHGGAFGGGGGGGARPGGGGRR